MKFTKDKTSIPYVLINAKTEDVISYKFWPSAELTIKDENTVLTLGWGVTFNLSGVLKPDNFYIYQDYIISDFDEKELFTTSQIIELFQDLIEVYNNEIMEISKDNPSFLNYLSETELDGLILLKDGSSPRSKGRLLND